MRYNNILYKKISSFPYSRKFMFAKFLKSLDSRNPIFFDSRKLLLAKINDLKVLPTVLRNEGLFLTSLKMN